MKLILTTLTALLLTLFGTTTFGATVTVVDPSGMSDFSVTYDTDEAGLFGQLILSNNTILFLPDSFIAESNNGVVGAVVSETLNLQLNRITAGFTFDSFFMQETGDYIVNGANAAVSAYGEMRVRSASSLLAEFQDSFSFSDNGDRGTDTFQWSGTTTIDSNDGWMGTTSDTVYLTLQNNLTAATMDNGEQAFIQKKSSGVSITVNPVPVPAAVWLFGSAMIALFGYRKSNA